jgi:hypothetical protein
VPRGHEPVAQRLIASSIGQLEPAREGLGIAVWWLLQGAGDRLDARTELQQHLDRRGRHVRIVYRAVASRIRTPRTVPTPGTPPSAEAPHSVSKRRPPAPSTNPFRARPRCRQTARSRPQGALKRSAGRPIAARRSPGRRRPLQASRHNPPWRACFSALGLRGMLGQVARLPAVRRGSASIRGREPSLLRIGSAEYWAT